MSYDPATHTYTLPDGTRVHAEDVHNSAVSRIRAQRDAAKARYRAYRAVAQQWTAQATNGSAWATNAVSVPEHAEVQVVEEGAFVEARIWVPRSALPEDQ